MFCPACKSVVLVLAERQGIEIDHCPTCRGVWLDRGELDKLIERSVQQLGAGADPALARTVPMAHGHRDFHDSGHGHKEHGYGQQGRRHSFWRDLFD